MKIKSLIFAGAIALVPFSTAALADNHSNAGDVKAGEKVFKRCKACHSVGEKAKNKVGPILNGVHCRKLGAVEGYKYSAAMMKKAEEGTIWTVAALDAYITNPSEYLGGKSKMTFKLKKEQQRVDVIAYLSQFNAEGIIAEPATCE